MHVQSMRYAGHALQLHAPRAYLARLVVGEGAIRHKDICLVDLKDRGGDKARPVAWLELHAAFDLTCIRGDGGGIRYTCLRIVDERPRIRQEARGEGEVRRNA